MQLRNLVLLALVDNINYFKNTYKPYPETYQFLSSFSKSSIRGVMRRLSKEGEIEKIIKNGRAYFSLTIGGYKACSNRYLNHYLSFKKRWDGKWRVIIFDVPEAKRGVREKLRKTLNQLNYGRIANSIYLSPADNLIVALTEIKKYSSADTNIFAFEAIGFIDDKKIASIAFRLDNLAKKYNDWIKKVKDEKESIDILISYYDAILQLDPALPRELLPMDWPFIKSWSMFINLIRRKRKIIPKKTGD